jgi:hypothetical protein
MYVIRQFNPQAEVTPDQLQALVLQFIGLAGGLYAFWLGVTKLSAAVPNGYVSKAEAMKMVEGITSTPLVAGSGSTTEVVDKRSEFSSKLHWLEEFARDDAVDAVMVGALCTVHERFTAIGTPASPAQTVQAAQPVQNVPTITPASGKVVTP